MESTISDTTMKSTTKSATIATSIAKIAFCIPLVLSSSGCGIKKFVSYPNNSKLYYTWPISYEEAKVIGDCMDDLRYFSVGSNYKLTKENDIAYSIYTKVGIDQTDLVKNNKEEIYVKILFLKNCINTTEDTKHITFHIFDSNNKEILQVNDITSGYDFKK